ncbi:MAG: GldG family protein [Candidatus Binatia bacterium]
MTREAETKGPHFLSRESTRRFFLLSLEVVFLLVIVVSVDALWSRMNQRYDLTPERRYSLSDVTMQTFQSLSEPVQATVFYRRGEREKHEELLRLLVEHSPNFSYQLFDLDRAPGVAQRYGVSAYGTTVVETAKNRVTIPMTDEERMLNAVLRATQEEKHIYFVVGHGESDAADMEERHGYGILRQVLETENYRVRPLPLRELGSVPQNADLVIVSGPKEDFSPDELDTLSRYLAAGGNALFLLDPYTTPGLAQYLVQFGFALADDVVVDTQTQMIGGDPLMPMIGNFSQEVFPRQPRGEPMLPVARPVHVVDGKAQAFAFSGDASWAVTNRSRAEQGDLTFKEGEDQRGPLPVAAVATTGLEKKGKIVVLGDSDFVDNFHTRIPGNVDFFMNTVGWVLGRKELVALGHSVNPISAKRTSTPPQSLYLTKSQSRNFFWLMVVVEPLIVFLFGMAVFLRRRQKG